MLKSKSPVLVSSLVVAALMTSASFAADGPRYTYGEVGYVNLDFDDIDDTNNAAPGNRVFSRGTT